MGVRTLRGLRLAAFGILLVLAVWTARTTTQTIDAMAYWGMWHGGLYDQAWNSSPSAYVYSPAFAQALWLLTLLPWSVFHLIWEFLLVGCLAWLVGVRAAALLAIGSLVLPPLWPIQWQLQHGNIGLPLAVMVAAGEHYPPVWAFGALTKITPGVGVLWFAFRREWRSLLWSGAVTLTIVAISFALAPSLWVGWIAALEAALRAPPQPHALAVPLDIRCATSILIIAIAARKDWPWLLPVAIALSLPQTGAPALVLLLAIPRLSWLRESHSELPDRLAWRRLLPRSTPLAEE